MTDADPHQLQRFVDAQDHGVWETARAELAAGAKRSHWMWFVFPQALGLGHSAMAQAYGIASLAEARAYLAHPVLGPRLRDGAALAARSGAGSLRALLGAPDDLKFISSMTLFALAAEGVDARHEDAVFREALTRWKGGGMDARTVGLVCRSRQT